MRRIRACSLPSGPSESQLIRAKSRYRIFATRSTCLTGGQSWFPPSLDLVVEHIRPSCGNGLSLPHHIPRRLIRAQADKAALAQMPVSRPFRVLKLSHKLRSQPHAILHLCAVSLAPHLPFFVWDRLANGHSLTSSGFILFSKSTRDAGSKPLRVREA